MPQPPWEKRSSRDNGLLGFLFYAPMLFAFIIDIILSNLLSLNTSQLIIPPFQPIQIFCKLYEKANGPPSPQRRSWICKKWAKLFFIITSMLNLKDEVWNLSLQIPVKALGAREVLGNEFYLKGFLNWQGALQGPSIWRRVLLSELQRYNPLGVPHHRFSIKVFH